MFNLEEAIDKWRNKLEKHPGLEPGYIEEMEGHLRDKIEDLTDKGKSRREAFTLAVRQFDEPEKIAAEYHASRTVRHRKPSWKQRSWVPTLLPNYLAIALRSFTRNKQSAFINTVGLSVGLACCLVILVYIYHESSYDRFHPNPDRLYRVTYQVTNQGSSNHYAVSVPGLAPALKNQYPEVASAVRISSPRESVIRVNNRSYSEERFLHADSSFFRVFGFQLKQGDPQSVLNGPGKVVLSQRTAQKYFGRQNPVGRTITTRYAQQTVDLEVTGIVETENEPSHIEFDLLASFETLQNHYPLVNDQNWWLRSVYTYIERIPGKPASRLEGKLPDLVDRYMGDRSNRSGSEFAFALQPVTDIHLHSNLQQELVANGDITYLYLFGAVAGVVLIIACINYMNLSTARYSRRAREVGVRKTLGANRWSLVKQFYGESYVVSLVAVLLSLGLAWAALPHLDRLLDLNISAGVIDWTVIVPGVLASWFLTGFLAGSYPALFLSSFKPARILKGGFLKPESGAGFRKILVVIQFTFSIALISGTAVIYQQLQYTQNKPLGFEKEKVLAIPMQPSIWNRMSPGTVRQKLARHSDIPEVAFASHYPMNIRPENTMIRPEGAPDDSRYSITQIYVDANYKSLLKLNLKNGRYFASEHATDTASYIINEAAARYFGWDNPLGKSLISVSTGNPSGDVIGVLRNFHQQSLHRQIEPSIYRLGSEQQFRYALVRFDTHNTDSILEYLKQQWQTFDTGQPFEYTFLDERYEALYRSEKKLVGTISLFTGLAIAIALLGLYGLVTFMIERRSKEIGIRKVYGATTSSVVSLLSFDFLKLVIVAFIISVPIAWYWMRQWLDTFAYNRDLGPGIFLFSGAIAAGIVLLTVSWKTVHTAMADPVHALREE